MLKGKNAIVTGSTSGIGKGIAEALANAGANVMLNGFGDAGEIEVFGKDILNAEPDEEIGVRNRWGVLFQGGALFSTLTVGENVEVPLKQFYPDIAPDLMHVASAVVCLVGAIDELPNGAVAQAVGAQGSGVLLRGHAGGLLEQAMQAGRAAAGDVGQFLLAGAIYVSSSAVAVKGLETEASSKRVQGVIGCLVCRLASP